MAPSSRFRGKQTSLIPDRLLPNYHLARCPVAQKGCPGATFGGLFSYLDFVSLLGVLIRKVACSSSVGNPAGSQFRQITEISELTCSLATPF